MKLPVKCGRCDGQIDIEEGMRISTCYSLVGQKLQSHLIEVDSNLPAGATILSHIERKPKARKAG